MAQPGPRKVLRKEAVYPHPPEKVWVAITDPYAIAEWLMPTDFRPVVGSKFRMQVDPAPFCGTGIVVGQVLKADPPRKLVYSWVEGNPDYTPKAGRDHTTVSWKLYPTPGGGTRLVLEHIGVEVIPWLHRLMMNFGWGTMVKRWIPKVAAHVDAGGRFEPGAIPLAKRCYKCKTIPTELAR